FGEVFFDDPTHMYAFGFTQILPFSFITYLIFWGSFGRLFNLRDAKRLVGLVDIGALMATFVAFFSIPQLLNLFNNRPQSLYGLALGSIALFILLFLYLNARHLSKATSFAHEKTIYKKLTIKEFTQNRYIVFMSLF